MKKFINSVLVLTMAAACMTVAGCKKENATVKLGARICHPGNSKVYVDDLTPKWHSTDQLFVNTDTYTLSSCSGTSASLTVADNSYNRYRAIYPASIVTNANASSVDINNSNSINIKLPRTQFFALDADGNQKVEVPMGAYIANGVESTLLSFHNLCSLLKVNITNSYNQSFTLSGIEVYTASTSLSGSGTATVNGTATDAIAMTTYSSSSSSTAKAVTLSFIDANNNPIAGGTVENGENGETDAKSFYIVCPAFSDDVTIQLLVGGNVFAKYELGTKTLPANAIANVNLEVTPEDVIQLSDLFSVSESTKVQFSKGNLQYQASTSTWRFAPNQYDAIGAANSYISSSYNGYIDLFNYGCSGVSSSYMPYSTSAGRTSSIAGSNYDWGVYNNTNLNNTLDDDDPLKSNDNTWRTLTNAEWGYLINTRSASTINGIANVRFAKATVAGQPGLILFPDVFVWPPQLDVYPPFNEQYSDYSINYTATQWTMLENMNAIFLPTTGHRDGTTISDADNKGLYWSATFINSSHDAYIMQFKCATASDSESNVRAGQPGRVTYGRAVRLVKNAPSASSK